VLAFGSLRKRDPKTLLLKLKEIADEFLSTRPTAVNLRWAVLEMTKIAETSIRDGLAPEDCTKALESRALSLLEEDIRINKAIGDFGAELIRDGYTILTHCNAGALATGGYGTALGVIRSAHLQGKRIRVLVDETRPWLQGHRLTAWELTQEGIEHYVIVDSAAGYFMAKGEVDMVVTGADRIAKNGDTANKIGTYSLAVLARENDVPFYIAAPTSTIDLTIPSGKEIQVEVRSEEEVLLLEKKRIGPKGTKALNPVFDITPARLITGIITELGIANAPFERSIAELFWVDLGTSPKI
ncbi:MAG: S-methyl-5-thioribose-1-phosphate isomerase, partial [Desulfatiglandales bacterium]